MYIFKILRIIHKKDALQLYSRRESMTMKNIKRIAQTVLFSAFMAVVVSMSGNTVCSDENLMETSVPVCCEELPDLDSDISGS